MPVKPARKKSGWKDVQSKNKKARKVKLALGVLALVVGFLVVSWAIRFTQNLFSPWKLQTNQERSYIWNGEFNINLLIRSDHTSILTYNPKEGKVVIINIPDETFLNVPFGFGLWQLRAIYELGESQKGLGGGKLLMETLTNFLAVPIDGFLDLSSLQPRQSAAGVINTLRNNPFSGLNLLSSLKTDLTLWELIKLKLGIGAVRFDKIKELNLLELNVLDKENLPDGTLVFTADSVKLDSVLSDLADPTIMAEHKNIAVLNTTDRTQLAQKAARLITNLGGNVIIMANATQELKKTKVYGLESATLRRLKQIFTSGDKINYPVDDTASSRAQVNLLVGEDYVNK